MLQKTDAVFVDIIHTHMSDGLLDWLLGGGYGTDHAIGHVDFVANGDGLQPGCYTKRRKRSREYYTLIWKLLKICYMAKHW